MARYGDVQFSVGGKTYTVRYGNLAWDELRRKLGAESEVGCMLKAKQSPAALLILFREGLATNHPEITDAEVRALYDEIPEPGKKGLNAAAWEAIKLAMPELQQIVEGGGTGPKAGRPPTPKRSSAKH